MIYQPYIIICFILLVLWFLYNTFFSKKSKQLILFWHPDCGHCTSFKPAWVEICRKVSISTKDYNCEENPDIAEKYNVMGYPTIILEDSNGFIEYKGNRRVEDIVKFCN